MGGAAAALQDHHAGLDAPRQAQQTRPVANGPGAYQ
jgi:hypothetical protein